MIKSITCLACSAAAMCLLTLSAADTAADSFPKLRCTATVRMGNPDDAMSIESMRSKTTSGGKWDSLYSDTRMNNPDADPADTYRQAMLVYTLPGALDPENSRIKYYFAFDEKLNLQYKNGTFAFSGRADSLLWENLSGWGTENINTDLIPLLVRRDLQQIDEPCYEFTWYSGAGRNMPRIPMAGGIILNYNFKVPMRQRTQNPSAMRNIRQSFQRGFESNGPTWNKSLVFTWDSNVTIYDSQDPPWPTQADQWSNLPMNMMVTAFAVKADSKLALFATVDGTVSAYVPNASDPSWTCKGLPPLIISGDYAYSANSDYSAVQAIRLSDGKTKDIFTLPRYLPRTPNSFGSVVMSDRTYLLFMVPAQSNMFLLEIMK